MSHVHSTYSDVLTFFPPSLIDWSVRPSSVLRDRLVFSGNCFPRVSTKKTKSIFMYNYTEREGEGAKVKEVHYTLYFLYATEYKYSFILQSRHNRIFKSFPYPRHDVRYVAVRFLLFKSTENIRRCWALIWMFGWPSCWWWAFRVSLSFLSCHLSRGQTDEVLDEQDLVFITTQVSLL